MVSIRKAARAAACLALLAGAGPVWSGLADGIAARRAAAAMGSLGIRVGAFGREPGTGRLVARDLSASGEGWRLLVGRLSLAAAPTGAALAAGEPAVSADDLRLEGRRRIYRVPHVELRGTALSLADLASILDPSGATPAADRLARLTASSLSAPTVVVEPRDPAGHFAVTLRDVALSGIAAGRVAAASARGLDVVDRADPSVHAEVGTLRADGVDLGVVLSSERADGAGEALRPALADASAEAIRFRAGDVSGSLGALRSGAVRVRLPTAEQRRALALGKRPVASLTPAQRAAFADAVAQALTGLAYDHLEASDLSMRLGSPDGSLRLARASIDDLGAERPLSILLEGADAEGGGIGASLARLAVNGVDQAAAAPLLRSFMQDPSPRRRSAGDLGAYGLWPSLALEGLSVSMRADPGDGNTPDRSRFVYEIPTLVVAGVGTPSPDGAFASTSHLRLTLATPDGAGRPPLAVFARLLPRVDLSTDGAASFDPAARRLRLDSLALRVAELGELSLRADFDRISPDLLRADPNGPAYEERLGEVAIRSLTLAFEDHGLAAKALPILAAQAGLTVPAFKASLKEELGDAIAEPVGSPALAARLAAAMRAFIDDPRSIRLSLDAPDGIPLERLKASDSLASFLGDADLRVVADE